MAFVMDSFMHVWMESTGTYNGSGSTTLPVLPLHLGRGSITNRLKGRLKYATHEAYICCSDNEQKPAQCILSADLQVHTLTRKCTRTNPAHECLCVFAVREAKKPILISVCVISHVCVCSFFRACVPLSRYVCSFVRT